MSMKAPLSFARSGRRRLGRPLDSLLVLVSRERPASCIISTASRLGSSSSSSSSSSSITSTTTPFATDCPITRNYAESGPCGKLFREWYVCRDVERAPALFHRWLQCLEEHDDDEQLDSFFASPVSMTTNLAESKTTATSIATTITTRNNNDDTDDHDGDATTNTSSATSLLHAQQLTVNNRVRAAWETFIEVDLAALQAFPFPDSLRPRVEWTPSGKVTILFRNDSTHQLVAIFVQSVVVVDNNNDDHPNEDDDATNDKETTMSSATISSTHLTPTTSTPRQLLAAAAPHNLLARRILSFQLPPNFGSMTAAMTTTSTRTSTVFLQVSAVFETDFVSTMGEPRPLEVLCTLAVRQPRATDEMASATRTPDSRQHPGIDNDDDHQEMHAIVDEHLQLGTDREQQ